MENNLRFFILIFYLLFFSCITSAAIDSRTQEPQQYLQSLYTKYYPLKEGLQAQYIPALANVNPNLFAIVVIKINGDTLAIGDVTTPFSIQSVSKVFVYALALMDNGEAKLFKEVGLNATGAKFNSIRAVEEMPNHVENPYVNAGAIQTTSLIKGDTSQEKFYRVLNFFTQLSHGKPYLSQSIYESESASNRRNRVLVALLNSYGMIRGDANDALDRYTKACSIMVTTKELAMMGAVLANRGVDPITHQRVIPETYTRDVLAEMVVNGLYEDSGTWFVKIGIPAKSGVSGAILAIVPERMAIVVYSPRLDAAGNSVKAMQVIKALSEHWQLHLLDRK